MRPKNLERFCAGVAVTLGLVTFGGAVGVQAIKKATALSSSEQNAQVTACAEQLSALGRQASQSQIEATPCRRFIDDFGRYQTVQTFYEPGVVSTDSTGKVTTDSISYSLPTPDKFLSEHFITPAQANRNKISWFGDAILGGGLAIVSFGIFEGGVVIPERRLQEISESRAKTTVQ